MKNTQPASTKKNSANLTQKFNNFLSGFAAATFVALLGVGYLSNVYDINTKTTEQSKEANTNLVSSKVNGVNDAVCFTVQVWQNLENCGWAGPTNTGYVWSGGVATGVPSGKVLHVSTPTNPGNFDTTTQNSYGNKNRVELDIPELRVGAVSYVLHVEIDGTVIDGIDLNGRINIHAKNVTIKNSYIHTTPGGLRTYYTGAINAERDAGYNNATITNNTVYGGGHEVCVNLAGYGNTIVGNNLSNCVDAIYLYTKANVVKDNYIHHFFRGELNNFPGCPNDSFQYAVACPHTDGLQIETQDISNPGSSVPYSLLFEHNTVALDSFDTGAISIWNCSGNMENVTINANLMAGGSNTVITENKGAVECGAALGQPIKNVKITNNVFSKLYFPSIGLYNIYDDSKIALSELVRTNNKILETGAAANSNAGNASTAASAYLKPAYNPNIPLAVSNTGIAVVNCPPGTTTAGQPAPGNNLANCIANPIVSPPPSPPTSSGSTITLSGIAGGQTISGTVPNPQAVVTSSTAVARVYFYLDGVARRSEGTAPYCALDFADIATGCGGNWNTKYDLTLATDPINAQSPRALANGSHTIKVEAFTSANVLIATNTISFVVNNSTSSTPTPPSSPPTPVVPTSTPPTLSTPATPATGKVTLTPTTTTKKPVSATYSVANKPVTGQTDPNTLDTTKLPNGTQTVTQEVVYEDGSKETKYLNLDVNNPNPSPSLTDTKPKTKIASTALKIGLPTVTLGSLIPLGLFLLKKKRGGGLMKFDR
jgi:hypothetical protein